jgi:hypothetical protein
MSLYDVYRIDEGFSNGAFIFLKMFGRELQDCFIFI